MMTILLARVLPTSHPWLLPHCLVSHQEMTRRKSKSGESVEIAAVRWKCRFRWRRIYEVQRIYCCCGTFYHTSKFLMLILRHLKISHAHSTKPWNFSSSFYHTSKFLPLFLPHLKISYAHSTTPWNFSCSFYDTLGFLGFILRHLGFSQAHSVIPWVFSCSFYNMNISLFPLNTPSLASLNTT